MNLTAETHIAAAPERVWARLTEPENWLLLVPMTRRVEVITPPPVGVGTRAHFTMMRPGGEVVSDAEVTAADPPHRLALRSRVADLGVEVEAVFTLTPEGTGTQVSQAVHVHFHSLLGRTVGEGMIRARNPEAHMREGLARLKLLVESAG